LSAGGQACEAGQLYARLDISPARLGARGQHGELLGASRTLFYDGARALLFPGILTAAQSQKERNRHLAP
jgi:hypothetical protein